MRCAPSAPESREAMSDAGQRAGHECGTAAMACAVDSTRPALERRLPWALVPTGGEMKSSIHRMTLEICHEFLAETAGEAVRHQPMGE